MPAMRSQPSGQVLAARPGERNQAIYDAGNILVNEPAPADQMSSQNTHTAGEPRPSPTSPLALDLAHFAHVAAETLHRPVGVPSGCPGYGSCLGVAQLQVLLTTEAAGL